MTVQSEIQRIKDNIADAYDSCDSKGATMPESLTSDNLADCIDSIDTANIQTLLVNPTTSQRTITAPAGTDGYNPVTVKAVTSAIDSNIKEGNIKSGVSILGVTGTLTELKGETKTVTPTTSNQTITPSTNYNGLTSVTVNAVTSAIDSNIKASNIKSGVSILGVNGTYTPDLYIGKRITQNGTYLASSDNKDGYYSVEVAVGTSTAGIYYKANQIQFSQALCEQFRVEYYDSWLGGGHTRYVYFQEGTNGGQNSFQMTEQNISTSVTPIAKIICSDGQQITGVEMYVSGFTAELASNSSPTSEYGVSYDSTTDSITILANYLNTLLGYTYYTRNITMTAWGSGNYQGEAVTTDTTCILSLNLNNGTNYFKMTSSDPRTFRTVYDANDADFALTYSDNNIVVDIYTSGWEYQGSSSGGNEQGGGSGETVVTPTAVTLDTTNNTITFSADYMTDLTSGQINSDVVIAKQGTNYQITQGNCNFQSQIWNTNDGVNTGYFRYENNQIFLTSSGNENGIFATVTYNYTSASQATNWQSDITITNVTITAPSNWAE